MKANVKDLLKRFPGMVFPEYGPTICSPKAQPWGSIKQTWVNHANRPDALAAIALTNLSIFNYPDALITGSTNKEKTVLNIPVIRWGEEYESLDKYFSACHCPISFSTARTTPPSAPCPRMTRLSTSQYFSHKGSTTAGAPVAGVSLQLIHDAQRTRRQEASTAPCDAARS